MKTDQSSIASVDSAHLHCKWNIDVPANPSTGFVFIIKRQSINGSILLCIHKNYCCVTIASYPCVLAKYL